MSGRDPPAHVAVAKALQCLAALRCTAAALSAAGGRQWTAVEVERALHSAAFSAAAAAGGSGSGKKRKR